ncbi:hypothetical protein DFP94_10650 [Fontibacillus phaseoli]|uniref:Uncharacterized protein n=1 Tax=Fontibacillus phaseoli TaxID=1416533 RepID=A0A369BD32_9BACL|nr:hypothetical protein [Fontibacillus phaseoli]RCX18518.1 hypothetical protein DFP94_10650 [Fontibacillus phaseoli]
MKNKLILTAIFILIVSLTTVLISKSISTNDTPAEYQFEIHTADFDIKDIHLVSFGSHLYLAPNYYMELPGGQQKFDGIVISGTIDGVNVLDTAIGGDPFHRHETHLTEYLGEGILFNGLKIVKNSIMKVHISYTVDSVKKDYYEDIRLTEKLKPFTKTTGTTQNNTK